MEGNQMVPLLINTPEAMLKIRVVITKDASAKALELLKTTGALHIEEPRELDAADRAKITEKRNLIRKISANISDILSHVKREHKIFIPRDIKDQPLDTILHQTGKLREKCARLLEDLSKLETDIFNMEGIGRHLDALANEINLPLKDLNYSGDYLFTKLWVFPTEACKTFLKKAREHILEHITVASEDETAVYTIGRTDRQGTVETLARNLGVFPIEIPDEEITLQEFIIKKDDIIRQKRKQIDKLEKEIETITTEKLEEIARYREMITREDETLSAVERTCETRYVSLIEGWVPGEKADRVISNIQESLDNVFIDSSKPGPSDEPPTKLQNPRAIRPFEVIVNLFSLPRYGGWDPTPCVAYFFAFFFGLMLCDVVYAAGLLILARFVLDKLVDDPSTEEVNLFRNVLYISGTVALIFGILSGTYLGDLLNIYFGIELQKLALAKWVQSQLSDPIAFIVVSLVIGLVHVNTAHILSLIRGIREKNKGLVVSKAGLFITELFGIPYVFKALLHVELIPLSSSIYSLMAYPMIIGLALIVVAGFMQMGGLGGIFWIFELTGLLGDIMSYSRLAGVGLATFYLASAFNLLADWISSGISGFVPGIIGTTLGLIIGIILFVIFHLLNLFLSSLAAFIHSLRLCFVEFLLKFYEGGGRKYAPLHIRPERHVIVGTKS